MHELQFMTNLVRMVEELCDKQSDFTPSVIKLQVASDSHIAGHTQDELQTMFQFVARGTKAHQARLEVIPKIITGQCHDCGKTMVCREETLACPSCDSLHIQKETSPEVVVQEITYLENSL